MTRAGAGAERAEAGAARRRQLTGIGGQAGAGGAGCRECRQLSSEAQASGSSPREGRRRRRIGSAALAAAALVCLSCAAPLPIASAASAAPRPGAGGAAFLPPPPSLARAHSGGAAPALTTGATSAALSTASSWRRTARYQQQRLFSRAAPPLLATAAGAAAERGGVGGLQMISSMFRWRSGRNEDGDGGEGEEVLVNIESPAANIRRISSSIVINRPPPDVWRILTDYDNLAEYVPNLTQSKTVPKPPGSKANVRLFQEGAQTIIGFNFKASLTMDMEEVLPDGETPDDRMLGQRRIKFTLVDSAMFADFSGEWRLQCYSRMPTGCADGDWTYSTKLFYMVNVKPKGPVPVGALEWRIREDVPTNLRAVKVASEKLPWECEQDPEMLEALAASRREQQARMTVAKDWMEDETLGAYIGEAAAGDPSVGGGSGGGLSNTKAFVRVGVGSTTGGPPGGNVNMRAVRGGAGGSGLDGGVGGGKAGGSGAGVSGSSSSFLERIFTRREG